MPTKIVDAMTGAELGRDHSTEIAIERARRKRPTLDNISYVIGEADIETHDFASIFFSMYKYFARYNYPHNFYVRNAAALRDFWRKILASREMSGENGITLPLSEVIGPELAIDFELLLQMHLDMDLVSGPDVQERWREMTKKGPALAKKHSFRDYVFAFHEKLGAIVMAPASLLAGRPNFVARSYVDLCEKPE